MFLLGGDIGPVGGSSIFGPVRGNLLASEPMRVSLPCEQPGAVRESRPGRKYRKSLRPTKCGGSKVRGSQADLPRAASIAMSGGHAPAQPQTRRQTRAEIPEVPKIISMTGVHTRSAQSIDLADRGHGSVPKLNTANVAYSSPCGSVQPSWSSAAGRPSHNHRGNRANRANPENLDEMGIRTRPRFSRVNPRKPRKPSFARASERRMPNGGLLFVASG